MGPIICSRKNGLFNLTDWDANATSSQNSRQGLQFAQYCRNVGEEAMDVEPEASQPVSGLDKYLGGINQGDVAFRFKAYSLTRRVDKQWKTYNDSKTPTIEINPGLKQIIVYVEPEPSTFFMADTITSSFLYTGLRFILTISVEGQPLHAFEFTVDKNDKEAIIDAANMVGEVKRLNARSAPSKKAEKQLAATEEEAIDMTLNHLFDNNRYLGADCSPLSELELKRIKDFIINDRSFPLFIEEVEKSLRLLHQGAEAQAFTQTAPVAQSSSQPTQGKSFMKQSQKQSRINLD